MIVVQRQNTYTFKKKQLIKKVKDVLGCSSVVEAHKVLHSTPVPQNKTNPDYLWNEWQNEHSGHKWGLNQFTRTAT